MSTDDSKLLYEKPQFANLGFHQIVKALKLCCDESCMSACIHVLGDYVLLVDKSLFEDRDGFLVVIGRKCIHVNPEIADFSKRD